MATACVVFYISTDAIHITDKIWGQCFRSKSIDQSATGDKNSELVRVLKGAAMDDRTVIITIVNQAQILPGSLFDLFLASFHIGENMQSLVNHLVVVTVDHKGLRRCQSLHPHCFLLTNSIHHTSDHLDIMWARLEFLKTVLQLGFNFIFSDTDVMWLRNPVSHFSNTALIVISSDYFNGNPSSASNLANTGLVYAKSSGPIIQFYRYWIMSRALYSDKSEQHVFNFIKNDKYALRIVDVEFLDIAYFGGVCSNNSRDVSKIYTMQANCCVDMQKKIHDLRVVLEDWKNYSGRSEEERRKEGRFTFRTPMKCK